MKFHFEFLSTLESNKLCGRSSSDIVIIDSKKYNSKKKLIDAYYIRVGLAYMGVVWDSLDEVLVDCDWMKTNAVYILHLHGIPSLKMSDKKIYLEVLQTAIKEHGLGPRKGTSLPQRKIDFHVAFVIDDEEEKIKLQRQIEKILI